MSFRISALRFLAFLALVFLSPVFASPGSEWLETQLNVDGSFQNSADIATPVQATAEVLRTFNAIDDVVSVSTAASLQFVNDANLNNTEN